MFSDVLMDNCQSVYLEFYILMTCNENFREILLSSKSCMSFCSVYMETPTKIYNLFWFAREKKKKKKIKKKKDGKISDNELFNDASDEKI
jgi:hypothetical protein